MPTAYIAIGSNDRPRYHIERALEALKAVSDWQLIAASPLYLNAAVQRDGAPSAQDEYVNAAVALEINLPALDLRRRLRTIESSLGRNRLTPAHVPIDLDLIAIDELVLDVDGHHLPDPDIERRAFVAVPFSDIAPTWVHPETGHRLVDIAAELQQEVELETISA